MTDTSNSVVHGELRYPFPDYPGPGEVTKVADGIYWLSTPLPFRGLGQVNIWLLRDSDGWTLIDCGYGWETTQDLLESTWHTVLPGEQITRFIVTHFHPDHIGNAKFICQRWRNLLPIMTQGEWCAANVGVLDAQADNNALRLAFYKAHGLDERRQQIFADGVVPYSHGVRLPDSYRRIRGGDTIVINGDAWTAMIGEGHSPEHLSLYCAARHILIAGDQVLPTITTNISVHHSEPEADPLGDFLKTGARFARDLHPATLVLPSHRKPFFGVQARLEALVHHHDHRLDLILSHMAEETTAGDLIDVLFQRKLDGHQIGFAMGEAIAHLNHLVALGTMTRQRDADGVYRYRRKNTHTTVFGPLA